MASKEDKSRRQFLRWVGGSAAGLYGSTSSLGVVSALAPRSQGGRSSQSEGKAEYTLRIESSAVEIAPKKIISTIAYNGQFPGPLLRFKEGLPVTADIHNHTDTPAQLHWHGQLVSTEVDGSRSTSRETMTGKCFWCSRNSSRHSARAATCLRIF